MKLKTANREKSIKEKDGGFFCGREDQSIDKPLARLRKKRDQKLLMEEMKEEPSLQIPWTLKEQ